MWTVFKPQDVFKGDNVYRRSKMTTLVELDVNSSLLAVIVRNQNVDFNNCRTLEFKKTKFLRIGDLIYKLSWPTSKAALWLTWVTHKNQCHVLQSLLLKSGAWEHAAINFPGKWDDSDDLCALLTKSEWSRPVCLLRAHSSESCCLLCEVLRHQVKRKHLYLTLSS